MTQLLLKTLAEKQPTVNTDHHSLWAEYCLVGHLRRCQLGMCNYRRQSIVAVMRS